MLCKHFLTYFFFFNRSLVESLTTKGPHLKDQHDYPRNVHDLSNDLTAKLLKVLRDMGEHWDVLRRYVCKSKTDRMIAEVSNAQFTC